LLIYKTT